MEQKRIYDILKNKEICDVYYQDQPVWIQEINNDKAKIGFLNSSRYEDVHICDLYEKNLFN